MDIKRVGKHLMLNRARVRRAMRAGALERIEAAIKNSEATHTGQIRFAVEAPGDGSAARQSAGARAGHRRFLHAARLGYAQNNGVLISCSLTATSKSLPTVESMQKSAMRGEKNLHANGSRVERRGF